jgi:hypothetical protein
LMHHPTIPNDPTSILSRVWVFNMFCDFFCISLRMRIVAALLARVSPPKSDPS